MTTPFEQALMMSGTLDTSGFGGGDHAVLTNVSGVAFGTASAEPAAAEPEPPHAPPAPEQVPEQTPEPEQTPDPDVPPAAPVVAEKVPRVAAKRTPAKRAPAAKKAAAKPVDKS